jgi:sialate O-acetylesterase
MFRKVLLLMVVVALLAPSSVRADVKPHSLCTDGMVLQQKMTVTIWGTADKGEKVTITFRGKTASATADDQGKWKVSLDSGAAGGPFPMTIAGNNKLDYQNVYVGEVWICSGQSNMQWEIYRCGKSDQAIANDSPPNQTLRLFQVPRVAQAKPVDNVDAKWTDSDAKTLQQFSGVAYFFGRDLQAALKIPVGVIHTSVGGTRAEAWTSREVLDGNPYYKNDVIKDKVHPNSPAALYNGMIYPLLNYRIKGAIWYQGESNAGQAYRYRELFPMMIQNWRHDWGQGDFPFLFVQLAPWLAVSKEPTESTWAELREAQTMTLKTPHTGMAVITDLGHEMDIHPTPKQPVGERLSRIARAQVYGEKIVYSGPMFKEMKVDANKAVLSFDHAEGLTAKELVPTDMMKNDKTGKVGYAWRVKEGNGSAELVGFTACGADKKFHNAKAAISGNTVVVTCEAAPNIVAVRYGWADHPISNLFNKDGLPASPFRTDDYPGITKK